MKISAICRPKVGRKTRSASCTTSGKIREPSESQREMILRGPKYRKWWSPSTRPPSSMSSHLYCWIITARVALTGRCLLLRLSRQVLSPKLLSARRAVKYAMHYSIGRQTIIRAMPWTCKTTTWTSIIRWRRRSHPLTTSASKPLIWWIFKRSIPMSDNTENSWVVRECL